MSARVRLRMSMRLAVRSSRRSVCDRMGEMWQWVQRLLWEWIRILLLLKMRWIRIKLRWQLLLRLAWKGRHELPL